MVLKMFTIYDRKTCIHHPPSFCHNAGHAMRFYMEIFRADNVFNKFPADFQIFEIGCFDDQSAALVSLDSPHLICSGTELVKEKESAVPVGPGGYQYEDNNHEA